MYQPVHYGKLYSKKLTLYCKKLIGKSILKLVDTDLKCPRLIFLHLNATKTRCSTIPDKLCTGRK